MSTIQLASHALGTKVLAKPSRGRNPPSQAEVTRDVFDNETLEDFWRFVSKRQEIYYLRTVERKPPPWTDDRILNSFHFTNVYRETDPGTLYARDSILELKAPEPDRVFNVMIYRLIGSSKTHKQLGFQSLSGFDFKLFERKLKYIRDVERKPPFTGAYVVSTYMKMGSRDKIENVSRLFRQLHRGFGRFYDRLKGAKGSQEAYLVIENVYGYGPFLAFQVLVDLMYPIRSHGGVAVLPFSQDEWAIAGPGAKFGIDILVKKPMRTNTLDIMRWLRQNQQNEFSRLNLSFRYLNVDGSPLQISLSNIENCLCEFHKYYNVKMGQGRMRRKFAPERAYSLRSTDSQSRLEVQ